MILLQMTIILKCIHPNEWHRYGVLEIADQSKMNIKYEDEQNWKRSSHHKSNNKMHIEPIFTFYSNFNNNVNRRGSYQYRQITI